MCFYDNVLESAHITKMMLDPIQCNWIDLNDVGSNRMMLGSDSKLYIYKINNNINNNIK